MDDVRPTFFTTAEYIKNAPSQTLLIGVGQWHTSYPWQGSHSQSEGSGFFVKELQSGYTKLPVSGKSLPRRLLSTDSCCNRAITPTIPHAIMRRV